MHHIKKTQMLTVETQQGADIDELTAFQSGWDFSAAQLGPGSGLSRVALLQTPRIGYHRFVCGSALDQRVAARTGKLSFGLQEPDAPPTWIGDRIIPCNGLTVFPSGDDGGIEGISPAGFSANGIHISETYIRLVAERVYERSLNSMVPAAGIYLPSAEKLSAIRAELQKWQQLLNWKADERESIVARREESLALAIIDALVDGRNLQPDRELKSDRSLSRALELIHESELETVSTVDLCHYAGCSQRTLESVFLKRIGITPKKYIKFLRMARVHHGLKNFEVQGCASIIELAGMHGFWHMGQFAADYRKIYGELPSETQARH